MEPESNKILKNLSPTRILLPVAIGLAVTVYLIATRYTLDDLAFIKQASLWGILASLGVLLARDLGYIYRIRHLTNGQLTWKGSFFTVILWEFASAVTPSAVGGTAIAVFILMKEKISFGKSLAYVMFTAVLDNLFFIVAAAVSLLFLRDSIFPDMIGMDFEIGRGFEYFFIISYVLIAVYTFIMAYGLFFKPRAIKWFLLRITSYKMLRKWRLSANMQGNEILLASKEMRGKSAGYWAKAVLSTIFIWTARYMMLNCLIAAFSPQPLVFADHILIFSRQVVMWIIMLISFTPGAAGLAEVAFGAFFNQFLGVFSTAVAIFWRLFTYYPYLLLGVIFLPRWVKRVFYDSSKTSSSLSKESEPAR
jgi:glycosyltransferase 2 family protein